MKKGLRKNSAAIFKNMENKEEIFLLINTVFVILTYHNAMYKDV